MTLFFVLSGYLITSLLVSELSQTGRVDLRAFYVRRVRRLGPALIGLLAGVGILMAVIGQVHAYPAQMVASLAYVSNLVAPEGFQTSYIWHTWSLSLEEQFYLLWPAAMLVVRRPRVLGVLAVAAAALIVIGREPVPPSPVPLAYFGPLMRGDAILLGCALAIFRWGGGAVVAVVSLGTLTAVLLGMLPFSLTVSAVASVGLVAAAESQTWLRTRWLVRVGQLSYGLYLWHYPIAVLLHPAPLWLGIPVVFTVSGVVALLSERWIERPWRLRVGRGVAPREIRQAGVRRWRPGTVGGADAHDAVLGG